MYLALLLTSLVAWPSFALANDDAAADLSANRAEYVRLSQELEKLATRNAWAGVERTYAALVATGVSPTFDDHVSGAHSARALGDVKALHDRLTAALQVNEDKETVEWLWQIDTTYGRVFLACDIGRHPAELSIAAMPFNPEMKRAIEFSQARISEGCMYDGLLPEGAYIFSAHGEKAIDLKVVPRIQSVRIDLRTKRGKKPKSN